MIYFLLLCTVSLVACDGTSIVWKYVRTFFTSSLFSSSHICVIQFSFENFHIQSTLIVIYHASFSIKIFHWLMKCWRHLDHHRLSLISPLLVYVILSLSLSLSLSRSLFISLCVCPSPSLSFSLSHTISFLSTISPLFLYSILSHSLFFHSFSYLCPFRSFIPYITSWRQCCEYIKNTHFNM